MSLQKLTEFALTVSLTRVKYAITCFQLHGEGTTHAYSLPINLESCECVLTPRNAVMYSIYDSSDYCDDRRISDSYLWDVKTVKLLLQLHLDDEMPRYVASRNALTALSQFVCRYSTLMLQTSSLTSTTLPPLTA